MASYYVNKDPQTNGDHEVHKEGCTFMPEAHNCAYLGEYTNCADAVRTAKQIYAQCNGCYYCAYACHTT